MPLVAPREARRSGFRHIKMEKTRTCIAQDEDSARAVAYDLDSRGITASRRMRRPTATCCIEEEVAALGLHSGVLCTRMTLASDEGPDYDTFDIRYRQRCPITYSLPNNPIDRVSASRNC